MRRHIAEPLNTGGLELHIGIKPTSHGAVDDGLPLLLQQPDKPILSPDGTTNAPINVVKIAHDSGLLGEGWRGNQTDLMPA